MFLPEVNMTKIIVSYERESKLPEWATPAILKAMKDEGKTLREIAKLTGVSYETVRTQILKVREQ